MVNPEPQIPDSLLDALELMVKVNSENLRPCLQAAYSTGHCDGLVLMAKVSVNDQPVVIPGCYLLDVVDGKFDA